MRRTISTILISLAFTASVKGVERPKDANLSRTAYTILQADEELADLNLGVRVERGGVAVIWGPVPNKQLMMKAEKLLEGIQGITRVVNQCELIAPTDTFLKEVAAALKGPRAEPDASPAKTPDPVVMAPPPPPVTTPEPDRQTVTVMKPKTDFITTANAPVPSPVEPVARLLEPEAMSSADTDHRAIERLRGSDRRFAGLRLELRDGRIVISGQAADPATAWELARRIAPHAGSRNIVVGRVAQK